MPAENVDPELYEGRGAARAMSADGLRATFHLEPVKDEEASDKAGRPIYHDVEFCKIEILGDLRNIIDRIATDKERKRFPQEYALFKAGDSEQVTGTPLKHWPGITKAQLLELAHFRIQSVEQLAAVSDNSMTQMGPFNKLRDAARDWLALAEKQAPTTALRAEIKARDKTIAALEQRLAGLEELLKTATDPKTASKAA